MAEHAAIRLPEGRQFAVTWGVTTQFGGMTNALLRRSRAFVTLSGSPVDILTFDLSDDYPEIEAVLRGDGRLIPGLRIRNFWDELADLPSPLPALRGTKRKALDSFSPLPGTSTTERRLAADGTLLQVDRHRADGSLAWSDRRDVDVPGSLGGRSIVICDREGQPVVGFTGARTAYRAWLDLVVGDQPAFFIVDSKTAAPVVAGYRNEKVTRIHLLHSSHLVGAARPWDEVKSSRREGLAQISGFEAVVALSRRQADDLVAMFAISDRIEVVPNSVALPDRTPTLLRDPRPGAVVASIDDRKRVDHAVTALQQAREAGSAATLDIYGDGPGRDRLSRQIEKAGLESAVTLRGFEPAASERFSDSSFFTLTSTTEGFPLVLAEGMSRGCIPVAYDIPYGPADLIDDGRTGYLIPSGDVAALTTRILEISGSTPEQLAPMREAAASAAAQFSDDAAVALWAGVMERARARIPRPGKLAVEVVEADLSASRDNRVSVDFKLRGVDVKPSEVQAAIALHGTERNVELRLSASVRRTLRHGVWRATASLPEGAIGLLPGMEATGHLEITTAGQSTRAGAVGA